MTTITQRVLSFVSAAVLTPASVPTFAATAAAAGELKCDVPFSFSVNGRELPAGVYAITAEHSTMLIKGVSRGLGSDEADAIDERLQVILQDAALDIDGKDVLWFRREEDVDYGEREQGETVHHVGAMYRLLTQEA